MRASEMIAVLAVGFGATAPAQVTLDEVLTLLEAGVPSASITRLLDRRGAPTAVVEADLERARTAGGGRTLLARLGLQLAAHRRLRDLAARFEVLKDAEARVSLLHPRGWVASPRRTADSWYLDVQREPAPADAWFQVPRLFVWIQRATPLPRRAQPEIGRKIHELVAARLRRAGMEPKDVRAGLGLLSDQPSPQHVLRAEVPRLRFRGTLLIRSRVLDDGTVVCAGFSCADGDLEATRSLFEELARSLDVRP